MSEEISGRVLSVTNEFAYPKDKIELKLEYLRQLRGLNCEPRFNGAMDKKIIDTCKSIESDLGIKGEAAASSIVVNLSVDTSDLERNLKECGERAAESAKRIADGLRSAAERISQQ